MVESTQQSQRPHPSRPFSVTLISWLFIAAGIVGFAYHATELWDQFRSETVLICLIRLLAIIAGLFMLHGKNWARWLILFWIAYHVLLSAAHSASQLIMHGLLLAVVAYLLFRPSVSAYFQGSGDR